MLAIEIIAGICAYVAAAMQLARHLVGAWDHNNPLGRYSSTSHAERVVGACLMSMFLPPIALIAWRGAARGQFGIPPKSVRREIEEKARKQEILDQRRYIAELEATMSEV